ncbi:peroxiredoxin Q/BCP [Dethiosulfatibacter aminovorans DSM 17477]|uniref:thioredoxin-dependent peroxiredoxin n=1 Tax=Dethiosulfatibacter aminovorans DSM 17477 TaxID=1121476 RepID=A0A1M6FW22_9FIRM|nr:peroxiredoxin [Dethiosulfatibacter aminovorans]SHJ01810.1 peroxiredoxin Q/BCP [Dethiosulfatibacter aminovorans DSM 17477]
MAKKKIIFEKGMEAPDFKLPGSDGKEYSLKDMMGDKGVVLFFYPKDNTPGCTAESCEFKEIYDEIRNLGFEVYGISKDSLKSHDKFIDKYELPFVLLSDEEIKTHEDYLVWKEKNMYGKLKMGVVRSTFVIGSDGKIIQEFRNIKAKGHALKIYNFIKDEVL